MDREKLEALLPRLLDQAQFLSDFGLRSLSREYADAPFRIDHRGQTHSVAYEPAEATGVMYGGNSNWRGPIWFPINFLVVEGLRTYHLYYGDDLTVEMPLGSGRLANLAQVADEILRRLVSIFLRDDSRGGRRPVLGEDSFVHRDEHWCDYIPFHEYFHGDSGAGRRKPSDGVDRAGRGIDGSKPGDDSWAQTGIPIRLPRNSEKFMTHPRPPHAAMSSGGESGKMQNRDRIAFDLQCRRVANRRPRAGVTRPWPCHRSGHKIVARASADEV